MQKNFIIVVIVILLMGAFLAWLFVESSKPVPGTRITDLGRSHVPPGTQEEYNSNPPTSGKHYAEWTRAGIYDEPKEDGYLVHSLEHGYVIMSYNCDRKVTSVKGKVQARLITPVYAHGIEEEASPSAIATGSGELSAEFKTEDCHKLVDQLISVYEKRGKRKLIVIPRPTLDAKIALTAWSYIDKMDSFDELRIEKFIDTHRDQGPEKTKE